MQETTTQSAVCQSCEMPLAKPEDFGREADGSASPDYCRHCYENGAFANPDETMEEAIESCIPYCREEFESGEAARKHFMESFPELKRWAKAS